MKIGVIGCGRMGGGMAARLAETGAEPLCWDADAAARSSAAAAGRTVAASLAAAAGGDLLILSLPNAAAVRSAMNEAAEALAPGAIVLDTTTSDPATSRDMAAMGAASGWTFLDAPVSGGPAGARSGTMTMLIGGDEAALRAVRSTLQRLAATIVHVGGPGAGHAAKIANNMLCAANLSLVAEATKMAAAAGVAPEKLMAAVNAGSGRSGVSEVNFPRWVLSQSFDSGFTMGLMRKDVALAAALAAETGVATPAFGPIAQLWADSSKTLPDDADFNEMTGLKR